MPDSVDRTATRVRGGTTRIAMLIALNKPFGVLSQFTSDGSHPTLAGLVDVPDVYAAGRLDADSEGLLLLTDDGRLQQAIADPASGLTKRYWAQVEGVPDAAALARFDEGLVVGTGADRYRARPASARAIATPDLPERVPPIRRREHIPTSWIEVELAEGRNRQVRRMTAAIGHPTLRLMRVRIGALDLFELALAPGVWIAVEADRLDIASIAPRTAADGKPPRVPRQHRGARRLGRLSTGLRSRR